MIEKMRIQPHKRIYQRIFQNESLKNYFKMVFFNECFLNVVLDLQGIWTKSDLFLKSYSNISILRQSQFQKLMKYDHVHNVILVFRLSIVCQFA